MENFSLDKLQLILMFFVPGFISMKIYDLLVPSDKRDFSKSVLEAISFGCINYAILYWPIETIYTGNFRVEFPVWYYVFSVVILFVAPVIWPLVYLKIISLRFVARKMIHPFSKPWDFLFSKREKYWVVISLKDGRKIGGRFDENSFASSYPSEEQIYIEEVWKVDEHGSFHEAIERSKGIIISHRDFDSIEFFQ